MNPENNSKPTKICPVCGSRIPADATHCLVCGTNLSGDLDESRPVPSVEGSRMPSVTLSLPVAIGLFALFLTIGAVFVYFALSQSGSNSVAPTDSPTVTLTPTMTYTPIPASPTVTNTPEPSPTPFTYIVKEGDSCGGIAFTFGVSVQSIVLMNNLPANCSTLIVGQKLLIPQPTPTQTPLPTSTLGPEEATEAACEKLEYEVKENDTLSSISLNYNVPMSAIREYNGLVNDVVRFGQKIVIPLCKRNATPGPTPTPTTPPPYPPASLLLPADGTSFSVNDDNIVLQWASVGTLRENEAYAVTIEDLTEGEGRKHVDYVTDTKYIVPVSFLPSTDVPHVIRWWVITVRQVGTDDDGNPVWEPAGAISDSRVFSWIGTISPTTPNP